MEESCTGYPDYSTSCGGTEALCTDFDTCNQLRFYTTGYYTVDTSDPDEVKASLYQDGPAYFRFDVPSDFYTFWSASSQGDVYCNTGASPGGGHAILIIGWDDNKNAWLCKNSWGATAGPNGDGTFWIARSGHAHDLEFGMANVEIEPRVWYVEGGVGSSGDGSSWTEGFKTIHEGMAICIDGDEIWVKEGTYRFSDYVEVDKIVGIYGGFEGIETQRDQRDWSTHVTTVDGERRTLGFDVVANAIIDGFTITNCSGDYGGAMMIVPLRDPPASISPTIRNCTFTNNKADSAGGAMYTERALATITNCVFSGNTSGAYGGAVHNYESSPGPTFTNCLFSGNTSDGYGGAVSNYMSGATYFLNCTFYGNKAKYYGGAISNLWHGYYITNSILWGDSAGVEGNEIYNLSASTTVRYSNIQGGHYGEGNINEEPTFSNAAKGDLHLQTGSPCIDRGTNTVPPLPALEPKPTPVMPDTDFEGDFRIIDGNRDLIAGADMGADEYVPVTMNLSLTMPSCAITKGPDGFGNYPIKGTITIENTGALTCPKGKLKVYASEDGNLDASDTLIKEVSTPAMTAGKVLNKKFSGKAALPTDRPEMWFIGVVEVEGEESDPCLLSLDGGVDLIGEWNELTRTGPDKRGKHKVNGTFSIKNNRHLPSGKFEAQVYYSDDAIWDSNDKPLLKRPMNVTGVVHGKAKAGRLRGTLDGDPSGKYLIIVVDTKDAIGEIDEGNNEASILCP
jgi:hypothetical protein